MPLNRLEKFGLHLQGRGASIGQLELEEQRLAQQQQQFDMARMDKRNEQVVQAAMSILKVAPAGSKARALAVVALNNAGFGNNQLLQALQESAPQTKAAGPKVVGAGGALVSPEGKELYKAAPAPRQQPSSSVERVMSTLTKLKDKQRKGTLSTMEKDYLDMGQAWLERQTAVDPMDQIIRQEMGGLAQTTTAAAPLTPQQQQGVNLAQQYRGKKSEADIKNILKSVYQLTDEQIRQAGF